MNTQKSMNLSMLCDFYELTMGNGYFKQGFTEDIAYFDLFFRRVPDNGGFAIAAGLSQAVEYIQNLHFDEEDIEFLRHKYGFDNAFLNYLKNFNFSCDVFAVPEGTPVFPGEPILTVRGPVIEAQLIETMMLLTINFQSLIATKANRIVRAAAGRPVYEFGSRRAQGVYSAVYGARAAYIAGCAGTANTLASQHFGIPSSGTMAHSWVQMFDSELDAFRAYARMYPKQCTLLVDTYNVLKSGVPNAIKVFDEELLPLGLRPAGIRLDSGDITYLSRKARALLDKAGYSDCKIVASNSLDEIIIRDTVSQGAAIDSFGVGERLITSESEPVFGGVYKLCAIERNGEIIPKIKVSENVTKITTPHFKKVHRIFSKESGKALADLITLHDECIDNSRPLEIFHPEHIWKRKTLANFYSKELLLPIFKSGKLVYKLPDIEKIRSYCQDEISRLWDEVLRFENPHSYYVDLSQKLWDIKHELIEKNTWRE